MEQNKNQKKEKKNKEKTISAERFSIELDRYKKQHNNCSVEKIIDDISKLEGDHKEYYRELFSRFKNGQARLEEKDLNTFSQLFEVRKEYLAGIDDYRTEPELIEAIKYQKGLFTALHQILVAIGYADTYMEDNDYNCTFPENTKVFLENYKKNCSKEITAICDVYEDLYIPISVNDYKQVLLDVVDYFGFKLSRLFTDALPIPDVTGIRPITNIKLKDGSSVNMRQIYVPNCELDYNTLKESWKFEEIPTSEKSSEE